MAVPTALAEQMKTPEPDLDDRRAIGDAMQMFWMDTDPAYELDFIAKVCSQSSYSLGELEAIFWNEVRSAVSFNLFCLPAPEWAGFEIGWLTDHRLHSASTSYVIPRTFLSVSRERLQASIDDRKRTVGE